MSDDEHKRVVRAALFDMDGTLVDTNDLHAAAWRAAFAQFGQDVGLEAISGQIGKGGDNLIPALLPDLEEPERDAIEAFRSDLFRRDYLPRSTAFAGVRGLFERLYADNVTIVIASSSGAEEVAFNLGVTGASDLVAATVSADEAERSKPCADIFAAALAKAAPAQADEAIVVGDTPWDVKAASKLGLRTIGFRSGGIGDDVLRMAGAVALYDGPEDLLRSYDSSLFAPRG